MSVCVLFPVFVHVHVVSVSIGEFCPAFFNGLLWQRITFNAYLLPEKSTETFKVIFIANGQLSALISP
jgi:hypothetical protein